MDFKEKTLFQEDEAMHFYCKNVWIMSNNPKSMNVSKNLTSSLQCPKQAKICSWKFEVEPQTWKNIQTRKQRQRCLKKQRGARPWKLKSFYWMLGGLSSIRNINLTCWSRHETLTDQINVRVIEDHPFKKVTLSKQNNKQFLHKTQLNLS